MWWYGPKLGGAIAFGAVRVRGLTSMLLTLLITHVTNSVTNRDALKTCVTNLKGQVGARNPGSLGMGGPATKPNVVTLCLKKFFF